MEGKFGQSQETKISGPKGYDLHMLWHGKIFWVF